ncbi:MAG TPA: hypothetical protein VJW20_09845 [Candidatus Angelobacter sp.]|nr:hypothetical protein [Candidatus Angelobacter sp.]
MNKRKTTRWFGEVAMKRYQQVATVRQPDGGTAVNGAAGPQNGGPKKNCAYEIFEGDWILAG